MKMNYISFVLIFTSVMLSACEWRYVNYGVSFTDAKIGTAVGQEREIIQTKKGVYAGRTTRQVELAQPSLISMEFAVRLQSQMHKMTSVFFPAFYAKLDVMRQSNPQTIVDFSPQ